jgi:hypothetical protein
MRRDVADKKLEDRRNEPNYKARPPRGMYAAVLPSRTEPRASSPEVKIDAIRSFRSHWAFPESAVVAGGQGAAVLARASAVQGSDDQQA